MSSGLFSTIGHNIALVYLKKGRGINEKNTGLSAIFTPMLCNFFLVMKLLQVSQDPRLSSILF